MTMVRRVVLLLVAIMGIHAQSMPLVEPSAAIVPPTESSVVIPLGQSTSHSLVSSPPSTHLLSSDPTTTTSDASAFPTDPSIIPTDAMSIDPTEAASGPALSPVESEMSVLTTSPPAPSAPDHSQDSSLEVLVPPSDGSSASNTSLAELTAAPSSSSDSPADLVTGSVKPPDQLSPEFNLIPIIVTPPGAGSNPSASMPKDPVTTPKTPVSRRPPTNVDSRPASIVHVDENPTEKDTEPTETPPDAFEPTDLIPSSDPPRTAPEKPQPTDNGALTAVNQLTNSSPGAESTGLDTALIVGIVGACGLVIVVLLGVELYLRRSRRRHIKMCEMQQPIMII